MVDSSTRSIVVQAPVGQVAAAITDFVNYPTWVRAVTSVEIVEPAEEKGSTLARQVRFHLDAGVLRDDYVLRYTYRHAASGLLEHMAWELVSSNTQRSQHGAYHLRDTGDGATEVTYSLTVELVIPMLGIFRRKAERIIMDTALRELKKYVEHGAEQA